MVRDGWRTTYYFAQKKLTYGTSADLPKKWRSSHAKSFRNPPRSGERYVELLVIFEAGRVHWVIGLRLGDLI